MTHPGAAVQAAASAAAPWAALQAPPGLGGAAASTPPRHSSRGSAGAGLLTLAVPCALRQLLLVRRRPRVRCRNLVVVRRHAAAAESPEPKAELRFAVGERVECNVDGWTLGVVVRHWYREPGWPEGQVVPYQVKLDAGMTIYAPFDEDGCIRKATGILSFGQIPVTVLTGFLGSGKTTLLNYILSSQHGKRYAVIENELGAVPIDEMLVDQAVGKQQTMESITVLDNGCLCCTMRDDLVEALQNVVKTVQERLEAGVPDAMIDGILIETTGVADPGPICKCFSNDAIVNAHCKIDGIITVVDAVHFLQQLDRERPPDSVNEPAQQVAFADKVLLNKVDAVDPARLRETRDAIRGVNALVPIKECSLAKAPDALPIEELLSIDAFDATRLLQYEGEVADLSAAPPAEQRHDHGHGHEEHGHGQEHGHGHKEHGHGHAESSHEHGHAHDAGCSDSTCNDPAHEHGHEHGPVSAHHDTDIGTVLLEMSGSSLDVGRFQAFLEHLLAERSVDMYRYKGVLAAEQDGMVVRYVLQGVHDMTEVSFSGEWPAGCPVKTQVVIIGRKFDNEVLQEYFDACAVDAKENVFA